MWITAPISWPLSKLLDQCFGHEKHSLESEEIKNILLLYKQKKDKKRPLLSNDNETVMSYEQSNPNEIIYDFHPHLIN